MGMCVGDSPVTGGPPPCPCQGLDPSLGSAPTIQLEDIVLCGRKTNTHEYAHLQHTCSGILVSVQHTVTFNQNAEEGERPARCTD